MNGYHVTVALAAMRRDELIAEATRARLVRESRAAAKRSRHARGRSGHLTPRPAWREPATGVVDRRPSGEADVASRHTRRTVLTGDRR